jgi:cytochrome c oxidase subunit 4
VKVVILSGTFFCSVKELSEPREASADFADAEIARKARYQIEEPKMHDTAHDDRKGRYFWVWGALLVLTAIEVVLAYKQVFEAVRMLEVLLILSVVKSALIIAYFMHLKFETALMRWMLVISVTACFIIMYFFFFPDAGRILNLGVK